MNGNDYVEETCAQYYPAAYSDVVRTPNKLVVTLLSLIAGDHVTKRVLRLADGTSDGRPYDVTHFQLQSWKMYDQVYITSHVNPLTPTVAIRVQL